VSLGLVIQSQRTRKAKRRAERSTTQIFLKGTKRFQRADIKNPKATEKRARAKRVKRPLLVPLSLGKAKEVKKAGAEPQRKKQGIKRAEYRIEALASPFPSGRKCPSPRRTAMPPKRVAHKRGSTNAASDLTTAPHQRPPKIMERETTEKKATPKGREEPDKPESFSQRPKVPKEKAKP
jgi:hypothetical protein